MEFAMKKIPARTVSNFPTLLIWQIFFQQKKTLFICCNVPKNQLLTFAVRAQLSQLMTFPKEKWLRMEAAKDWLGPGIKGELFSCKKHPTINCDNYCPTCCLFF